MKLTHFQHHWLYELLNHEEWQMWIDPSIGEDKLIRGVLKRDEYDDNERDMLNKIVEYYIDRREICGTMKNPL